MKSMLSGHSIVVAARDQISSNLDGEVAILDLKVGIYYGLGTVGARIWDLIQEPRTVNEVRDILLSEYDVEPDRCERELLLLLQSLRSKKLIKVKNETFP